MYTTYADEDACLLLDELPERTSDIPLAPAMSYLLLGAWLILCAVGLGVAIVARYPLAGAMVVAVPTFVGMVIRPTFALCILMLVLPTGAGVGWQESFSLDRAVGLAMAVSFVLNALLTRPGLKVRHRALWVAAGLSAWIGVASLMQPHLAEELQRAFTQFQLVLLILIVYWILETNHEDTCRWALRCYVVGMLGSVAVALRSGQAIRAVQETRDVRYSATLGHAIDANMLSALIAVAFLSAIYLLARDRSLFWRAIYLMALVLLPIMMLRTGSRGGLVALAFTLLSPLLFVRQVLRRPALAVLLLTVIVLASVSAGLLVKEQALASSVAERLTNVGRAKEALAFRAEAIQRAIYAGLAWPMGTGYISWFERTGSPIWPHSDFFFSLGVYGIPGAALFTVFVILLMLTVKRAPLTVEKLYARAVLTFLLVMGLNIKQVSAKYYWIFLAFVLAAERLGWGHAEPQEQGSDAEDEEAADTGG